MQLKQNAGSKMQFNKENMHLNEFCKHEMDLHAISKHVGAKMQFYKVKFAFERSVNANRGSMCNFEICRG